MNFFIVLGGLLTPLIAIIAVYIAYQQYQSNKKQGALKLKLDSDKSEIERNRLRLEEYRLRLDLYNKRFRIFEETKKILYKVNQDAKIELSELQDFKFSTNESQFLFNDEIPSFFGEIQKKAIELSHLTGDKRNIKRCSRERDTKITRDSELTSWFTYEYENIENRFKKYLDFKNL